MLYSYIFSIQGLSCLDMNAATQAKSDSQRVDAQAECNPSEAIPMAYKREKTPPSPPSYVCRMRKLFEIEIYLKLMFIN